MLAITSLTRLLRFVTRLSAGKHASLSRMGRVGQQPEKSVYLLHTQTKTTPFSIFSVHQTMRDRNEPIKSARALYASTIEWTLFSGFIYRLGRFGCL